VEGAVAGLPPERPPALLGGTETVLLVEDEPSVRGLVREILTAAGYRVLEAGNGPEALRRSAEHTGPIHLMVTDVVMPGMSGPELAARMGAIRPGLRILFTSGYADDDLHPDSILGPGRAFIQKPLNPDDLTERVREILDRPL
jgi:CheY-like chemotaxis protein